MNDVLPIADAATSPTDPVQIDGDNGVRYAPWIVPDLQELFGEAISTPLRGREEGC